MPAVGIARSVRRLVRAWAAGVRACHLEDGAIEVHPVLCHRAVEHVDHPHIDLDGVLERVRPAQHKVGLDDWDDPLGLADECVACLVLHVALDRELRRLTRGDVDVERRTPLGKHAARRLVFTQPLGEGVQTLHHRLPVASGQLVHRERRLDTGQYAPSLQHHRQRNSGGRGLEDRLGVQNCACYVVGRAIRLEEGLTICAPPLL